MERNYTTLSLKPETKARLKQLAKQKGCSMTEFLVQATNYFYQTARDPGELGLQNDSKTLLEMKKQLDHLERVLKSQERKTLGPMAQAVFGIEQELIGSKVPIYCPRCEKPWEVFEAIEKHIQCRSCSLEILVQMGQYRLTQTDIITLLTGGITRYFEAIDTPNGDPISGRFFLNDAFALRIQT